MTWKTDIDDRKWSFEIDVADRSVYIIKRLKAYYVYVDEQYVGSSMELQDAKKAAEIMYNRMIAGWVC